MGSEKHGELTGGITFSYVTGRQPEVLLHSDMVLLYGIRGECQVRWRKSSVSLRKEDILVVNLDEPYTIDCGGKAALTRIQVSSRILGQLMEGKPLFFDCCSPGDTVHSFRTLRHLLRQLVLSYLSDTHVTESYRYGLVFTILDELIGHFLSQGDGQEGGAESLLIRQILSYVNLHYAEPIRLREIADQFYTSMSSLSRQFHKETGVYFEEYVRRVRLSHACRMLEETDEPMIRIAMDCGFSTSATFNRVFRESMQMIPTEYRKAAQAEKEKQKQLSGEGGMKSVLSDSEAQELREKLEREETGKPKTSLRIELDKDTSQEEMPRFMTRMIVAGRAQDLLMANMQYHIQFLARSLHSEYVVIWNLFSVTMVGPWQEGRRMSYDSLDTVLDFLNDNGLKPFMDLTVRPETAVRTENQTVYYSIPDRHVPGREEFNKDLRDFLRHIKKRYGEETVSGWRFVFSESFNGYLKYYDKDTDDYEEILKDGIRIVHEMLPSAMVGGPGGDITSFRRVVRKIKEAQISPDFFTMMCFPLCRREDGSMEKLPPTQADARYDLQDARQLLDQSGFEGRPLVISDYNLGISTRSFLNDSCGRAAYLLEMAGMPEDPPEMAGLWMATDWSSTYYDVMRVSYGGSGMITRSGVRKPVFYALTFLDSTGEICLHRDRRCIVTRRKDGEWVILLNNRAAFSADYYTKPEDTIPPQNVGDFFRNQTDMEVELVIPAEDGQYVVKTSTISPSHGSLLSIWGRFQYEDMEGDEASYLRNQCVPELFRQRLTAEKGRLRIRGKLEPNAIRMIRVREEE